MAEFKALTKEKEQTTKAKNSKYPRSTSWKTKAACPPPPLRSAPAAQAEPPKIFEVETRGLLPSTSPARASSLTLAVEASTGLPGTAPELEESLPRLLPFLPG